MPQQTVPINGLFGAGIRRVHVQYIGTKYVADGFGGIALRPIRLDYCGGDKIGVELLGLAPSCLRSS